MSRHGEARLPQQLKPGELDSLMLPCAKQKMASRVETEYFCVENNQYGLPGGISNPASRTP